MRWREAVKKDALKTPTGGTLTKTRELIALFDFGQVEANANAESGIYGCKCGEKKSKGTDYTCCEWGSLRIDLQRPFKLGSTHWASFNVQHAGCSFAALNVQCGVNFDALGENLRASLTSSLNDKVRMWVGNDEGKTAFERERRVTVTLEPDAAPAAAAGKKSFQSAKDAAKRQRSLAFKNKEGSE